VTAVGCCPAELTSRCGVDALSFGFGQATVLYQPALAQDFAYRMKQSGQLGPQMCFLSAPWLAHLREGLWLECARQVIQMVRDLASETEVAFSS
jgi:threonine aldolase